jgi:hypothetical protein
LYSAELGVVEALRPLELPVVVLDCAMLELFANVESISHCHSICITDPSDERGRDVNVG